MKTLNLKINLTFGLLFIGLCLTLFGASAARAQSAPDAFDPNVNGTVYSVVVQPDGKILVGGAFTAVSPNGGAAVTRNNIARFNSDGSLDAAFVPNPNAFVSSIAIQLDGKILIIGGFTTVDGQTRNHIARLDAANGAADSLNPNPNENTAIYFIEVQPDGKIIVSGNFK